LFLFFFFFCRTLWYGEQEVITPVPQKLWGAEFCLFNLCSTLVIYLFVPVLWFPRNRGNTTWVKLKKKKKLNWTQKPAVLTALRNNCVGAYVRGGGVEGNWTGAGLPGAA
jgi:hypothetical protein